MIVDDILIDPPDERRHDADDWDGADVADFSLAKRYCEGWVRIEIWGRFDPANQKAD